MKGYLLITIIQCKSVLLGGLRKNPKKTSVRAGGGGAPPLICAPSAEDVFGGWLYDNRSASRVINHRQWINKMSRMRDRSESRVMKIDEKNDANKRPECKQSGDKSKGGGT